MCLFFCSERRGVHQTALTSSDSNLFINNHVWSASGGWHILLECFLTMLSNYAFYHSQTKLQEGNVFTSVCLSTVRRGYLWPRVLSGGGAGMSRGWVLTSQGGYIQGGRVLTPHPCRIHGTWDTTGYGRQVGGMNPTGMLSCYLFIFIFQNFFFVYLTLYHGIWSTDG